MDRTCPGVNAIAGKQAIDQEASALLTVDIAGDGCNDGASIRLDPDSEDRTSGGSHASRGAATGAARQAAAAGRRATAPPGDGRSLGPGVRSEERRVGKECR